MRAPQPFPFTLRRGALTFVGASLSLVGDLLAIVCDAVTLIGNPLPLVSDPFPASDLTLTTHEALLAVTGITDPGASVVHHGTDTIAVNRPARTSAAHTNRPAAM